MITLHNSWVSLKPLRDENSMYFDNGFEKYCERIVKEIGDIPSEVLEQWVYRLSDDEDVTNEFGNIDYTKVKFELQEWCTNKMLNVKPTKFGEDFFERRIKELANSNGDIKQGSYGHLKNLINHWNKKGTWKMPPIIMISECFKENEYQTPYQLVEGHNRLAWIKYFALNDSELKLAETHKVWVMKRK
ncbi:hypothetical protein ACS2CQ_23610 [Bacillus cereus group sp. BceL295]|uniref:hypothetical protein n=1 Tax=Bacillus cereus group sp. BceL295 TaxID=3444990 RepID=UPI003F24C769